MLLRFPDVSADHVVFRFDADLWIADRTGGAARRLTSSPGGESLPKFSPDGNHVAFMGSYDGGSDLYTVAVTGGVPERATWHPGRETFSDWTPDGEHLLYFSSEAAGVARAAKVMQAPRGGGQPTALPLPYGTFSALKSTGDWLAYTPISREFRTWRRYRGGTAQDIWLYNLKSGVSRRMTDNPASDSMPMWDGERVIFLSDRGDAGISNLWSYDVASGETTQLTTFDRSGVRFPSIGPTDVVFEHDGKLYRYELAGGAVVEVVITIPTDRRHLRPVRRKLKDAISDYGLSPKAKRVVVEARGDIFTVPVEEGVVRNLTRSDEVAERYPSWSPDGRWIAYWSDRSGEYELTLRQSDGGTFDDADENGERRLTSIGAGWKYGVDWSPDSKKMTFVTFAGDFYLYQLEDDELTKLFRSPEFGQVNATWSRDSRWLTWSHEHSTSKMSSLWLYDLENPGLHEVTSGMFNDSMPCFDVKGEWLYFVSSRRFSPTYGDMDTTWIYTDTDVVMGVPLRKGVENPWLPKNSEESFGDDAAEDEDGKPDEDSADEDSADEDESKVAVADAKQGGDEKSDKEAAPKPVTIDLDGFESRAMQLPITPGRIMALKALDGSLLYARGAKVGARLEKPAFVLFDIKEEEEKTVFADLDMGTWLEDGSKILVRKEGKMGVIEPKPDQKIEDPIAFDGVEGIYTPAAEWKQMLRDSWRINRDFFYDPGMHGLDWPAMLARYEAALVDATSREDLHFLIGEMISELNVGHAYNRGGPGAQPATPPGDRVGLLGCDWKVADDGFEIERVLGSSYDADGRSPLALPGIDIEAGSVLVAVQGAPVDSSRSVHEHLVGCAERATELTFREANGEKRTVIVKPLGNETALRYRDWVAGRRRYVEERTGGRVGYVHVPSTGIGGQNELYRQFLAEMHHDALIVDERWNSGGQIPTRFIELLDRPFTNFWATHGGQDWDWPPVGHRGPKCMLINQSAGSGGDAFPFYFRQSGLGKLIGTRTWGGLVGISGNPSLIDGAQIAVPTFGFFELDGTWGIENHGVEPDIEVQEDPAEMVDGADPQLDVAIRQMLEELKTWRGGKPARPAGPDRRGAGIPESDR